MAKCLLLLSLLLFQDPGGAGAAGDVAAAREVLARIAAKLEGVRFMRCEYVQRQQSLLLDEPIVSEGRMLLRAEPGCLVLRVVKPREVVIRSDATSHQVYHPAKKRAERFVFASNDVAKTLLRCFTPEVGRIEESFTIRSFTPGEKTSEITFVPRDERVRAMLTTLGLTVREKDATLVAISHENAEGEETRLELSRIEYNPKELDARATFDAPLPKDVRLVVQRVDAKAKR